MVWYSRTTWCAANFAASGSMKPRAAPPDSTWIFCRENNRREKPRMKTQKP